MKCYRKLMERFNDLSKKDMQKVGRKTSSYEQKVLDFLSYGFTYENVEGILYSERCDREKTKKIILKSLEKIPPSFSRHEYPPISFQDVSKKVEHTIRYAHIEDIEYYFDKFTKNDILNFKNRIKEVRELKLDIDKLLSDIEPYIDGLIVDNNAFAIHFGTDIFGTDILYDANEKETFEAKLFGVWPVFLIQRREKIDQGDLRLLNLIKEDYNDDIFYFLK